MKGNSGVPALIGNYIQMKEREAKAKENSMQYN